MPADRAGARRARDEREAEERAHALRSRRLRWLAGAGAAVVLVVAVVLAVGALRPDPAERGGRTDVGGVEVRGAAETTALLRGLPQRGETLGRLDTPVTILEIADLKCPSCQAHELGVQQEVVDRLVRTGRANLQMQLVNFRDAPAGTTDGEGARRAAYAFAALDRFWNFVHATFWNQGSEQEAWASEPLLRAIAGAVPGIEPAQVRTRKTPASREGIAGAEAIARALGTTETPSIYVVPRGSRTGTRIAATDDVDAIARAVAQATPRAR